MPVVQLIIERPGLVRSLTLQQFSDPIRFVRAEHRFIESVLDRLEGLSENLQAPDRRERADGVVDYFRTDFPIFAADEQAVASLLERGRRLDPATRTAVEEVRDEHAMLRRLLDPVVDGLEQISAAGVPLFPRKFVVSSLILCEFLRFHIHYLGRALLSAITQSLTTEQMALLGRDMALRRGLGSC